MVRMKTLYGHTPMILRPLPAWLMFAVVALGLAPDAAAQQAGPKQASILRFDFGPDRSEVYPGFTRVGRQGYASQLGYGWRRGAYRAMSQAGPDALYRDWVVSRSPFVIDLPNGRYGAWLVIGDNDSYTHHGFTVYQDDRRHVLHRQEGGFRYFWDWYFSLQDLEWAGIESFWDTYVDHKFKAYTVDFEVKRKQIDLGVAGRYAPICCLIVYPQHLRSRAQKEIAEMLAKRRAAFDRGFRLQAPKAEVAPGVLSPEDRRRGFVLLAREYTEPVKPDGTFTPRDRALGLAARSSLGEFEPVTFTILPLKAAEARVGVTRLQGPEGGTIPASGVRVRFSRYAIAPNRPVGTGARLVARELVEREGVALTPYLPQRVWVTLHVPSDARPGTYRGRVTVSTQTASAGLPLELEVAPIRLDPASHVVRGGFYYFPDYRSNLPDSKFWELTDNDMRFMAEHGLNSATNLPELYRVLNRDGSPNPEWPQKVDKFVALYRKHGFTGPIAPYSLIALARMARFPAIGKDDPVGKATLDYMARYLSYIKREEKRRGWPEILVYGSDELSSKGTSGGLWGKRYYSVLRQIRQEIPGGFRTMASLNGAPALAYASLLDIAMPNAAFPISQEWIDRYRKAGHELWFYNIGWGRFAYGWYVWRTGATGRFQWHFDARPYSPRNNPYNPFDCRVSVDWVFAFPGRDGQRVPTPSSELTREGVDDLRYVTTLEKLIAARPTAPAAREAREWLAALRARIHPDMGHYRVVGQWHASAFAKLRRGVADRILRIQAATR